jgi:hypothetical protein
MALSLGELAVLIRSNRLFSSHVRLHDVDHVAESQTNTLEQGHARCSMRSVRALHCRKPIAFIFVAS